MIEKVRNAHGERHPELRELYDVFLEFCIEIDSHAQKEERILFPLIAQLESAEQLPQFHCGSISNRITVMEEEHEHAGDALARMRELTDTFTQPPDTCSTYRVLLHALKILESDMHQHVHEENNILFPRALALEEKLRNRSRASIPAVS